MSYDYQDSGFKDDEAVNQIVEPVAESANDAAMDSVNNPGVSTIDEEEIAPPPQKYPYQQPTQPHISQIHNRIHPEQYQPAPPEQYPPQPMYHEPPYVVVNESNTNSKWILIVAAMAITVILAWFFLDGGKKHKKNH